MTAPSRPSLAMVLAADLAPGRAGWPGWAALDAPERFARHAATVAAAGVPPADGPRDWVTWRQANREAARSLLATGPGGPGPARRCFDVATLVRTLDHLLAGHVLAYDAVKAARPGDWVRVEIGPHPVYEMSALLVDLLGARAAGIARPDLGPWLADRRRAFYAAQGPRHGPVGRVLRAWSAALVAAERALPRAVAALEASPHVRPDDGG